MTSANITSVRAQFPSLSNDQVYLDNAGGSQILGTAISSITSHLTTTNVQLGATYKSSLIASEHYASAYAAGAAYVNADPGRVVFGPSTTQLLRNLSHALAFDKGDEIVLSEGDHESNISPWLDLADRQGLVIKWWRPDPETDGRDIVSVFTPRTRLVCVTHASNVLGTVHPIRHIASHAHAHGALLCVDGVAFAPYGPIDVRELGVDFYVFSWYKVFGPHVAMLYAGDEGFRCMRSLGHYFHDAGTLEGKLGLAAASYELLRGIPDVVSYLGPRDGPMRGWMAGQHRAVTKPLLDYLVGNPDRFKVHGRKALDDIRLPIVTFSVEGWRASDVVAGIQKVSKFGARAGHFYAPRLVGGILGKLEDGDDGVVRVSMAHYNTVEEVEGFVKVLDNVVEAPPSTCNIKSINTQTPAKN